jgi:hypothetical protein
LLRQKFVCGSLCVKLLTRFFVVRVIVVEPSRSRPLYPLLILSEGQEMISRIRVWADKIGLGLGITCEGTLDVYLVVAAVG